MLNARPDQPEVREVSNAMSSSISEISTPPTPATEASPAPSAPVPVVRVQARPGWIGVNLSEFWRYRDLLGFLTSRDIKVRYKQTALGIAWALLQPVGETLAWFFLIHKLAGVQSDGPAYMIFAYAAMLVWKLFEAALTQSSNSLVANQQLLTKVYFPRLIIPVSAVMSGIMDFAIGAALLIPLMAYYQVAIGPALLLLPLFVAFTIVAALAVGLWLSALNVQYRDVRYVVPFLIRIWFVLTPVIYPASKVPEKWQMLYGLNPMAGVVTGFRWALLGGSGQDPADAPGPMLFVSVVSTIVLLIGGLFYFRRMEKTFADIV
jgi:lipopolysaccharide transport system permease protein